MLLRGASAGNVTGAQTENEIAGVSPTGPAPTTTTPGPPSVGYSLLTVMLVDLLVVTAGRLVLDRVAQHADAGDRDLHAVPGA